MTIEKIKGMSFESKFKEWFNMVIEPDEYSEGDGNSLEERIYDFFENPNKLLAEERKFQKEMNEEMHKWMEEDIKSGAFKLDEIKEGSKK